MILAVSVRENIWVRSKKLASAKFTFLFLFLLLFFFFFFFFVLFSFVISKHRLKYHSYYEKNSIGNNYMI